MRRPYRYLVRVEYENGEIDDTLFHSRKKAIAYHMWVFNRPNVVSSSFTDLWGCTVL